MARGNLFNEACNYEHILTETYERYKDDFGYKIGDHKLLCNLFTAQDQNLREMLAAGYDIQAKAITDVVKDMLAEQEVRFEKMLEANNEALIKKVREMIGEVKSEVDDIREDVEMLKKLNSFWAIITRIGIGVAIALGLIRLIHGKF